MSGRNSENDDEGYNREETRATRLKADTEQAFNEYRDERGLTDAEALRRLVRKALDPHDETLSTVNKTALVAGLAYVTVYFAADPTTAGTVGAAYITFMILWSTYPKTVGRYLP
jgi:hypothetical protein